MEYNVDILKYKIYAEVLSDSGFTSGFGFVLDTSYNYVDSYGEVKTQTNIELHSSPPNDFYLTIPLKKSESLIGYADIKREKDIYEIERQDFDPFFIEYGFFNSIRHVTTTHGYELNTAAMNYVIDNVQPKYPSISAYTGSLSSFQKWFSEYGGKNLLGSLRNKQNDTELDMIDKLQYNWDHITSKAQYYPINIYK